MKASTVVHQRPAEPVPPSPPPEGARRSMLVLRSALSLDRSSVVEIVGAVALVGLVVATAYHVYLFRTVGSDDAYITFRHADNLRSLRGMSYDTGERVEATSSFLFTILLAVVMLCGGGPEVWSRILGGACLCALVVVTYLFARRLMAGTGSVLLSLQAAALVGASTHLAYWGASGMETLLFALLVMLASFLQTFQRPSWPYIAGLAALTRPEGVVWAGVLVLVEWTHDVAKKGHAGAATRAALRSILKFLAVFGPVLAFRLLYFGELVPNSVIAKSGFLEAHKTYSLREWWHFLGHNPGTDIFLQFVGQWSVGSALAVVAVFLWQDRFATTLRLAATVALGFLICVWDEGDWMGWFRLLVPTMAPLAVLLVLGLRALLFQVSQRRWGGHAVSYALVVATMFWLYPRVHVLERYVNPHEGNNYLQVIAMGLRDVRRPEDTVAADMVGVLGFYSRMHVIDMMGLATKYVARYGKRFGSFGKVDDEYVAAQKPTFYMFHSVDALRLYYGSVSAFASQRSDYVVVMTPYAKQAHDAGERVLAVRKDRPDLEEVRRVFDATFVELDDFLRSW
jgi:hypothetical protein